MPDYQGVLMQDERDRADAWFRTNWTIRRCPICNQDQGNWSLADHVVVPIPWSTAGPLLGGATYPQIMVNCGVCGYTVYINAIIVGIVPRTGGQ
jgi:hypothetical protein